jgi:NTP pyrophosphatase (non-canonical NTP hydrolase)
MSGLNDYQQEIVRISKLFKTPEDRKLVVYMAGLFGETGEVVTLLESPIFGYELDMQALVKELGDVLAYLALIADSFSFSLQDIVPISKHDDISENQKLVAYQIRLTVSSSKVSERLKKHFRDNKLDKQALAKELGNVLNFLTLIANYFGFTLEEIANHNLIKLDAREQKGTLQGSGDDR